MKLLVLLFNLKPSAGLAFAVSCGLSESYGAAARALLHTEGADRGKIGNFLGQEQPCGGLFRGFRSVFATTSVGFPAFWRCFPCFRPISGGFRMVFGSESRVEGLLAVPPGALRRARQPAAALHGCDQLPRDVLLEDPAARGQKNLHPSSINDEDPVSTRKKYVYIYIYIYYITNSYHRVISSTSR